METSVVDIAEPITDRRIISQTQAAKLRKISRQRIHQLVSSQRLTVPVDESGKEVRGGVYLDEVLSLTEGPRGRPRLSEEEKVARGLDDSFKVGDAVSWSHVPRDGYGFSITLEGTVLKAAVKKLKVMFRDADGVPRTAWVRKENCTHAAEGQVQTGEE